MNDTTWWIVAAFVAAGITFLALSRDTTPAPRDFLISYAYKQEGEGTTIGSCTATITSRNIGQVDFQNAVRAKFFNGPEVIVITFVYEL